MARSHRHCGPIAEPEQQNTSAQWETDNRSFRSLKFRWTLTEHGRKLATGPLINHNKCKTAKGRWCHHLTIHVEQNTAAELFCTPPCFTQVSLLHYDELAERQQTGPRLWTVSSPVWTRERDKGKGERERESSDIIIFFWNRFKLKKFVSRWLRFRLGCDLNAMPVVQTFMSR